ncbi:PREDICTED: uncharacterized protein LOC105571185, partial [Vollenhovia emeryi]|uniref:uncharacterized protein LOC105571185 n=1 Tax=Vollenhovia emeryi TaxID=411798 RepID=UPI0005F436D5
MRGDTADELSRIHNAAMTAVNAQESIGRPLESHGMDLFDHLVVELFDSRTRLEWESSISDPLDPPSHSTLMDFMSKRILTLNAAKPKITTKGSADPPRSAKSHFAKSEASRCALCKGAHSIGKCVEFKAKAAVDRKSFVESNRLCYNCLGHHLVAKCTSVRRCLSCNVNHHSLLHDAETPAKPLEASSLSVVRSAADSKAVLLATARVSIADRYGAPHAVRALVDQGSEVSLVSESLAQRLRLPRSQSTTSILGIGDTRSGSTRGKVTLRLTSTTTDTTITVLAFVLPRLSAYRGTTAKSGATWSHVMGLPLADPQFLSNDPIELLLGAEVCSQILEEGLRRGDAHAPIAQKTSLGWILSGGTSSASFHGHLKSLQCTADHELVQLVRRFWELDAEPATPSPLTPEESQCEDVFVRTHKRASSGRYTVRLPFATTPSALVETRRPAEKLLVAMERKCNNDAAFGQLYRAFMREYEDLEHMEEVAEVRKGEAKCYLPHHGVLKEASESTKLRVVFNGSQRTSSGESLNSHLLVGANLLPALSDVLIRWRCHRYVFVTDIAKIECSGVTNVPGDIREYRLRTVTYGLACAPYLAIRTLRQLADDEEARFPRGAEVLRHDCYVDDIMSGAQTLAEARTIQTELNELCMAGGFPLRKWASNHNEILSGIPREHRSHNTPLAWNDSQSTLGLRWNPVGDYLAVAINARTLREFTKRRVLSETARLFDPLGWLAPVVVQAKVLMPQSEHTPRWCTSAPRTSSPTRGKEQTPTILWSDSKVTLHWIKGHVSRWKTFVANRVSHIQQQLPDAHWRHVPGRDNPADCASRGVFPSELKGHSLWWSGPAWLRGSELDWPRDASEIVEHDIPEKRVTVHTACERDAEESDILLRFSDLHKLLRVTAWCLRWRSRLSRTEEPSDSLLPSEVDAALHRWLTHVQGAHYGKEVLTLRAGRTVPRRSTLAALCPFLDPDGAIRVGGRLKHAVLSQDERHPLILPATSWLTRLVVESCHRRTLHGGVQLTLGMLRLRFWVPRGRSVVKQALHRCVTCVRWRAATPQPIMGDLPRELVTPSRPFLRTGVDYAGPIFTRTSKGRGQKAHKAFIAVFVCLSTKAVHLELVSDYTSEAFLAAFRRFVSRRGLSTDMYSDCGTNFIGADKELRRLFRGASSEGRNIVNSTASEGVTWHFNPPAAPHFGGLWEAAVKSAKHHLRRVIGETTLTFEEMSTLLSQIEACLNSRPLQALSDDPDDVSALSPGHFLIGAPLLAVPEPTLVEARESTLSRWQHVQQMRDHFLRRWSCEYLHSLTSRPKWQVQDAAPHVGDLCLLRHDVTNPVAPRTDYTTTPGGRWRNSRCHHPYCCFRIHSAAGQACDVASGDELHSTATATRR